MKLSFGILMVFIFGTNTILAQNDITSGKKVVKLEEVVVSAQIEPQSVKKSVKNVQVITKEQIKNLGATNLADVLNQYINITVLPDTEFGGSKVSMFGLGAKYFKVFVDNVPLINESGFGNNSDLSQVNLDDIERVEIIEGAMGVTHGANAVSGILNVITKKRIDNAWEINYTAQEETVGKEYNLKDKGRHIQSFKATHRLNDAWTVSAGTHRNKFSGFFGDYGGKYVLYQKRGYTFLPREYLQFSAYINYKTKNSDLSYKFEKMNQDIDFYERNAQSGYSDRFGAYRFGNDKRYFYERYLHNLNAYGKLYSLNYNVSMSYQKQTREEEHFRYIITRNQEINNERERKESMNVLFSTGTLSRNFDKVSLQLGYEITNNKGFATVNKAKNKIEGVEKQIDNYDVFLQSEIKFSDRFSIQPGGRFSYQSLFDNQYAYALGVRYLTKNQFELRSSVGKAYRTPDFYELYSNIMFEGHYFLGNENLLPESSLSADVSLKKNSQIGAEGKLINQFVFSHNRIKDRIFSALVGFEGATPKYQQINVNKYNLFNISTTNNLVIHNFDIRLGISYLLVSQYITNNQYQTDDRYLPNISANLGVVYKIPKWNTSVSAYYKFKGKTQGWTVGTDGYLVYSMEPYGWLDASIEKKFFDRKVEVSFGVRNLLDVTSVNRSIESTVGHTSTRSLALSYGRSYFLKIAYNLNINK